MAAKFAAIRLACDVQSGSRVYGTLTRERDGDRAVIGDVGPCRSISQAHDEAASKCRALGYETDPRKIAHLTGSPLLRATDDRGRTTGYVPGYDQPFALELL